MALLEIGEKIQDLGLDRHVERRDRLVQHQDFRIEHQRPGNGDALPLTAGEHMRIARVMLGTKTDIPHHRLGRARAARPPRVTC